MRLLQTGVAALVVLAAAACGINASPADGLLFQAPPGWQSSPGIMGFMQFWRPPSGGREVLILFKSPKPIKPSDITTQPGVDDSLKNTTVERREDVVICGHQPATYMEARGTSSHGDESRVEMMMATLGSATYLAIYVRPLALAPHRMAEASLRELCPKP
jgi:hypothetical protein